MKFKVVDDSLRAAREPRGELTKALVAGKTLLLDEAAGKGIGAYYSSLRKLGFQLRTHKTEDGVVVWAEKNA